MISIVLPTYNGARFLPASVDSCLKQTLKELELIVVVDGSTDESEAILSAIDDPRLTVVKSANQGLPRALNTGFERARGEYLTWTSDDNLYLPDALEVMSAYLDRHPRAPMVATDYIVIDEDGQAIRYGDEGWACFLYRAEAARQVGGYRPEYGLVEDVDFFLRLQHTYGPIARISGAHYKYREHRASLSSRQLGRRQVASLRLHYDLISRNIEPGNIEELFFCRLERASALRDSKAMDEILAFGRARAVPFLATLELRDGFLRTRPGWLYNRARLFVGDRVRSATARFMRALRARR